jgi:hypothetical protein
MEYPICHCISKSFENFTNMYAKANENFMDSFIFDSKLFTLGLESREYLNRNHFDNIFFSENSYNLYKLKYSNFYDDQGNIIGIDEVRDTTGVMLTELQVYRCRGVCTTAKIRYKKKAIEQQETTSIETFINRRKRGSSHIRKILEGTTDLGPTRNINKFADNLDIVISGEQSKFLNSLWSKNYFSNQDKTFFFKFYNNTLGYNAAVAHFVQGHSPFCSFCDITMSLEQNIETPVHLFYDCRSVCDVLETVLKTVTSDDNFVFSRREYFTTFERREAGTAYNQTLTIVAKLVIKYFWDCKTHLYLPTVENCLDNICEKIGLLYRTNSSFSKVITNSRLPFFARENFLNNNHP